MPKNFFIHFYFVQVFWEQFYPSCTGLSFIRCVCKRIYLICLNFLLMHPHYSVGILLGMCPSVLFKNVRGLFMFIESVLLEYVE